MNITPPQLLADGSIHANNEAITSQLIGNIYENTNHTRAWESISKNLARQINAQLNSLSFYCTKSGKQEFYTFQDPSTGDTKPHQKNPIAGTLEKISNNKTFHISYHQSTAYAIYREDSSITILSLESELFPLQKLSEDLVKNLIPHFRRSANILSHIQSLLVYGQASIELLNRLQVPAVIFDQLGRITYQNKKATTLLQRIDPSHDRKSLNITVPTSKNLTLAAESGFNFSTTPLPLFDKDEENQRFLAIANDNNNHIQLNEQILSMLFKITNQECNVCNLIIQGKTAKDAAIILNKSEHTVRSHLKSIHKKTNSKKRTELISILFSSPAWWII